MRLPIIVSAILPVIVAPESNDWVGVVVGITTWLVFGADYVVHVRHLEHYGRTGFGRFDLFVVIATAPWFLLPGAQADGFVVLLRLTRLARLAMASKGSRRLFDRLGRIAVVAGGVLVTGSLVAYYAEHPANPGFANGRRRAVAGIVARMSGIMAGPVNRRYHPVRMIPYRRGQARLEGEDPGDGVAGTADGRSGPGGEREPWDFTMTRLKNSRSRSGWRALRGRIVTSW